MTCDSEGSPSFFPPYLSSNRTNLTSWTTMIKRAALGLLFLALVVCSTPTAEASTGGGSKTNYRYFKF